MGSSLYESNISTFSFYQYLAGKIIKFLCALSSVDVTANSFYVHLYRTMADMTWRIQFPLPFILISQFPSTKNEHLIYLSKCINFHTSTWDDEIPSNANEIQWIDHISHARDYVIFVKQNNFFIRCHKPDAQRAIACSKKFLVSNNCCCCSCQSR